MFTPEPASIPILLIWSARKGAGRGLSQGAPLRILSRLSHPANWRKPRSLGSTQTTLKPAGPARVALSRDDRILFATPYRLAIAHLDHDTRLSSFSVFFRCSSISSGCSRSICANSAFASP